MTRLLLADYAPRSPEPTSTSVPTDLLELLAILRDVLAEADPPREHRCGTGWRCHGGRDRSQAPECCREAAVRYESERRQRVAS